MRNVERIKDSLEHLTEKRGTENNQLYFKLHYEIDQNFHLTMEMACAAEIFFTNFCILVDCQLNSYY